MYDLRKKKTQPCCIYIVIDVLKKKYLVLNEHKAKA